MATVFLSPNARIWRRTFVVLLTTLAVCFLSSCTTYNRHADSAAYSRHADTAASSQQGDSPAQASVKGSTSEFKLEGKWKNVGKSTFGQVQSGAIVVFDGVSCNVYSPVDKYGLEKKGDGTYALTLTGPFGDSVRFTVIPKGGDMVILRAGDLRLQLKRVQ